MENSQSLIKFAPAFAKLQGEMKNAPKNAENPFFKNRYADLACIIDTARPILSKYGFSIIQGLSSDGKTAIISTMLLHESGEFIKDVLKLDAKDSLPQSLGSAYTYGRRYAYSSILGMATDEDDDGNESTNKTLKNGSGQEQKKETIQQANELLKPSQNQEIDKIKHKLNELFDKMGIQNGARKTAIMKAQEILKISGQTTDFKIGDWAVILEYFTEMHAAGQRKKS